jgi:hypothetical protein
LVLDLDGGVFYGIAPSVFFLKLFIGVAILREAQQAAAARQDFEIGETAPTIGTEYQRGHALRRRRTP